MIFYIAHALKTDYITLFHIYPFTCPIQHLTCYIYNSLSAKKREQSCFRWFIRTLSLLSLNMYAMERIHISIKQSTAQQSFPGFDLALFIKCILFNNMLFPLSQLKRLCLFLHCAVVSSCTKVQNSHLQQIYIILFEHKLHCHTASPFDFERICTICLHTLW